MMLGETSDKNMKDGIINMRIIKSIFFPLYWVCSATETGIISFGSNNVFRMIY